MCSTFQSISRAQKSGGEYRVESSESVRTLTAGCYALLPGKAVEYAGGTVNHVLWLFSYVARLVSIQCIQLSGA